MMHPAAGESRPRVVVLRALGLGDLLTAVPALRAIARAFPSHRRVLVAPTWLAPLVGALKGVVTDLSHADFRPAVGAIPARAAGAEVAINLHGRGPDSHRALLACEPERVVAYPHPEVEAASAGVSWQEEEHEVSRWCRLLEAHGIAADPGEWRLGEDAFPPERAWEGAVALHPGAASAARRWPPDRWAEVARAAAAAGRQVVITGSVGERPLALDVARRAGLDPDSVRAGRTGLAELARGLAAARLVVSGDTGVAHLATALGRPSVLLFGPSSPQRWGPPPDQDGRHVVLWAGRTGDPHAPEPDPGLLEISAEQVVAAVASFDRAAQPATA